MHKIKKNSGISIIETMVALMILSGIGVALMLLNVQIQAAANSSRFRSLAQSQVQKMLDQVREKKISGGGTSVLGEGCFKDGSLPGTGNGTYCTCTPSPVGTPNADVGANFNTFVKVSPAGTSGKYIQAAVIWTDKGKKQCTEADTYLYDY